MSNEILFRTQLASIMEVLANAAVEEICKLVDDGYAVLHLQMSEYQKENETLKMRLHLMELNAARACAGRASARENPLDLPRGPKECPTLAGSRVLRNHGDVCLEGLPSAVEEDNPAGAFGLKQVETEEARNGTSELILIKEENPEECADPHADLKVPPGALDAGAGEEDGVPALGLGVLPAERSGELAVSPRTGLRSGVWEVSGLEAVLRLQAENPAGERPGEAELEFCAGSERGAGVLRAAYEAKDPARHYRGRASGRPAQPDLRPVSEAAEGPRVRLSPGSPGLEADVVVIDSVKEECVTLLSDWDPQPTAPGGAHALRRRRPGDSGAEEPAAPPPWPTGGDIAAAPASDAGGLNGLAARERSFGAPGGFSAGSGRSPKEKRFLCRFCGKAFSRQNALEIHQRVHTGEKPFRCLQCGKRFSDSSNHRRHQSVHSRERPFSCAQCERSFSHHYQLKVHQRVHSGDRPFACVHCGKKFGERSFLKMHQQRDHALLYVA